MGVVEAIDPGIYINLAVRSDGMICSDFNHNVYFNSGLLYSWFKVSDQHEN
jgi:hypothetical protein